MTLLHINKDYYCAGASMQPYKYGDKELDLTAGVARYDYAARAYFTAIPRFDRPDALAGK